MGKIEIEVNGKPFPCRPTMGAFLRFKRETGREVTEMGEGSFTDLCTLLWCCVVSASAHDGLKFGLSLMEFADSVSPEDVKAWADVAHGQKAGSDSAEGRQDEKKPGITELLGFALGCVGMSLSDFCGLTPEEFECVCDAYHRQREADYRDGWKRMRMLATVCIQPHVKKRISARELLPFSWDKAGRAAAHGGVPPKKTVSAAESKARLEKLTRRLNGDGGGDGTTRDNLRSRDHLPLLS